MEIVAVQLTGRGVGAIGVVMVAGAGVREFLLPMLRSGRARELAVGGMVHTAFVHPQSGVVVDDVVVARVGEERFEVHLHGGVAVVAAAMEALAAAGAEIVLVDDVRARALLGGGIAGEILQALPLAKGMTAARLVAAQAEEGLGAWGRKWRGWLAGKSSNDLWELHSAAQWVLWRGEALGKLLRPARAAIVGAPNAGKSTLANALLGRPVSITSEVAGTTRDWVDAEAMFVAGEVEAPVVLVDTAGIRETSDELERESIARTHEQAAGADVIVLVFDGGAEVPAGAFEELRGRGAGRVVVVANKMDAGRGGVEAIRRAWPGVVEISALQRSGIERLMERVMELLELRAVDAAEPFAFTGRQRAVVEEISTCGEPRRTAELLEELWTDSAM